MVTIKVPQRFYDDHVSRDLMAGTVVRTTKTHYWVEADASVWSEIRSDAVHYSDFVRQTQDPSYLGLQSSARATVRAIEAAGVPAV